MAGGSWHNAAYRCFCLSLLFVTGVVADSPRPIYNIICMYAYSMHIHMYSHVCIYIDIYIYIYIYIHC